MPAMTPPPPRPRLKPRDVVVTLLALVLAVVVIEYLDRGAQAVMDTYPRAAGWGCTALAVVALAVSRGLRHGALAMLTIVALTAPFIAAMLLVGYACRRAWPQPLADQVSVLAGMLPLTLLMFWVLVFANRRPATGRENVLRRAARSWGARMPEHQPGLLSYATQAEEKKTE